MMKDTRNSDHSALVVVVFAAVVAIAGLAMAEPRGKSSAIDLSVAARPINALGLDLLRKGSRPTGNAVISPYSIQLASGMVYAGAAGTTRGEMAATLHYPDNDTALHASFAALTKALEEVARRSAEQPQRRKAGGGRPADPIMLAVANRLYGQMGRPFRWPFIALLKDTYRAPMSFVDFSVNAPVVTKEINAWVAEQTRQRIRDLLPDGALDRDTRLVVVNAIYLKAPWKDPFGRAQPLPFAVNGGKPVDVATMNVETRLGYARTKKAIVLTIPYTDPDLEFLVLLPDKGTSLTALEASLTPDELAGWARISETKVNLYLPKFRIEPPAVDLSVLLSKLGMKTAFIQGAADFRGIDSTRDLYVSHVFHKAFLLVDEQGTEAAAATAYLVSTLGMVIEEPPKVVHVDRPFLYAIQHRPSGTCLFLGRVTDPR